MSDPRAHVIIMPKNFVVLRSFQLAIAVILFAFGIFGAIYAPVAGVILTLVTVRPISTTTDNAVY